MSSIQRFSSSYTLKDPRDKDKIKKYHKIVYFDPMYLIKIDVMAAEWIAPDMYALEIKFGMGESKEANLHFNSLAEAIAVADNIVEKYESSALGCPKCTKNSSKSKNITILKTSSPSKDEDDK